jgi:hypothetical protein
VCQYGPVRWTIGVTRPADNQLPRCYWKSCYHHIAVNCAVLCKTTDGSLNPAQLRVRFHAAGISQFTARFRHGSHWSVHGDTEALDSPTGNDVSPHCRRANINLFRWRRPSGRRDAVENKLVVDGPLDVDTRLVDTKSSPFIGALPLSPAGTL